MMKSSILAFFLFGLATALFSQSSIKKYVQNNVSAIHSIDIDDLKNDDLTVFGKAIGNARIVMLGEQDHGDAPTFEAKSRIIRYLHEQLGFDVIAFESDFYSLTREWDMIQKGDISISKLIENNIFVIWTKCQQAAGLFDYIKACHDKNNEFIVAGFDNQTLMPYSQHNLKKEVNGYLASLNLSFVTSPKYNTQFLPFIDSILYYSHSTELLKSEANADTMVLQIDSILSQIRDEKKNTDLGSLALENLRAQCNMLIFRKQDNYPATMEARDSQMASNLAWLANVKYPTKKIIVWAASYHLIKDKTDKIRHVTMGYYFSKKYEATNTTYTLGFVSYGGKAAAIHIAPYEFHSSEKESVEEWIHEKNFDYAFIDFQNFSRSNPVVHKPFYMAGIRHLQQEADWTKSFDGVFYINNMYPCTLKQ